MRVSQHREASAFFLIIGNTEMLKNRKEKFTAVVLEIESFEIKKNGRNGAKKESQFGY